MSRIGHLFGQLGEEAAEVIVEASKCNRFTPNHFYNGSTNLERLRYEVRDFMTMIAMIEEELDIKFDLSPSDVKRVRVENFLQISKGLGVNVD